MGERLAQLWGSTERVRGVDPELGGGGRLAQLRGRKSGAVGLHEDGGLAQLRDAGSIYGESIGIELGAEGSPS